MTFPEEILIPTRRDFFNDFLKSSKILFFFSVDLFRWSECRRAHNKPTRFVCDVAQEPLLWMRLTESQHFKGNKWNRDWNSAYFSSLRKTSTFDFIRAAD